MIWSKDYRGKDKGKVFSKHKREIGACKVHFVENKNLYQLKLNGKIFAQSLVELPLLKSIEDKKEICESFGKDQDITGCKIPKLIKNVSPDAPFVVVPEQNESQRQFLSGLFLNDGLEAAYNFSKAGLCGSLQTTNKCHATYFEPADKEAKSDFKISIQQGEKTHEIEPKSKKAMYYISRILFSSKCKKTFKRGNKCHITSLNSHDEKVKIKDVEYQFNLGGTEVYKGDFYNTDNMLVAWNSKLCGGAPVNKCELVEKVEGEEVSFYLEINGEKACAGKHCSWEGIHHSRHEQDKRAFQLSMMNKYPHLVLNHGCFYKEGFASRFLNGIADSYYQTENERLREELRRSIASKKVLGEQKQEDVIQGYGQQQ